MKMLRIGCAMKRILKRLWKDGNRYVKMVKMRKGDKLYAGSIDGTVSEAYVCSGGN